MSQTENFSNTSFNTDTSYSVNFIKRIKDILLNLMKPMLLLSLILCLCYISLNANAISQKLGASIQNFFSEEISFHLPYKHFRELIENLQEKKPNSQEDEMLKSDDINYRYNLAYEFISNITSFPYSGEWTNLKVNGSFFNVDTGRVDLYMFKNETEFEYNYISNIEKIQSIFISYTIKEGDYIDHFVKGNVSLSLPNGFSNSLDLGKNVKIVKENLTMPYVYGEFFGDNPHMICNNTQIELEFIKHQRTFTNGFTDYLSSDYGKIAVHISDPECGFNVDFNLGINAETKIPERVWNYSLILTTISIVEIFFTIKLIIEVSDNAQVGLNLDLVTISMSIIWNAFICTIHFYMSITIEEYSYEYGTPSMTFFLLFSIFELRLLFFVWKSRYNDLMYTNLQQFRHKLLRFYSLFCKNVI